MNICPACKTQYTDETLVFCLQDGTPLTSGFASDTPTVVLGETETVAARNRVDVPVGEPGSGPWPQSQVTRVSTLRPEKKRSSAAIAIVLTAVGMVLLFGALGIAALIYFKNSDRPWISNVANNANSATPESKSNSNSAPIESPTPAATRTNPTPIPSNTVSFPTPPPLDEGAARSEVSQQVYDWKSMLESRNLNGYMGNYANTVDYFSRRNASVASVRADKARAFALYSSMRVNVSNMTVSVSPAGETATATFDKEWDFKGRDTSSGKVRSQLAFRKINGRWMITAEKDLKVYYTR